MPSFQGNTKLKPWPRKNEPMITSTAQNIRKIVNNAIANFRSSGLFDGFESTYGAMISRNMPMPGMVTPATIGWNMVSSSCRPRKYHGAFDGFGVWFTSARPSSGARTIAEKMRTIAVMASAAANSTTSRWGQVCTLSCASARVCWIEPDLTTVSRRWVWPPGPVPVGVAIGAVATAAAATAPPASPPPPPAIAALRLRDRSSKCAGTPPLSSVIAPSSAVLAATGAGVSAGVSAGASAAGVSAGASSPPSPPRPSCLRRSALRFSRCSGTSSIGQSLPGLQRSTDAAVLADAPEVDRHEDDDDEREQEHVERVPAQQRVARDLLRAEQGVAHLPTEDRRVPHHV